ncbi:VWA domain-containing protein [Bacillus niameyensis]|uniref:VWA domain-containing protein n=1 Tax=Bacillus niameyensis TaxID=1522308 RepID=UPI00078083D2|nr:VWA domain-containing protein [Bacillus niameyensis]
MGLEFKHPILLLLLLPASLVIYLFVRHAKVFTKTEKTVIAFLRSSSFGLLIISLAVPQILMKTDEYHIVFVADTSASMKGTDEEILSWIEKSVEHKKEKDQFAILALGKDAALEQAFSNNPDIIQTFSTRVDRYDTNFENGLQLAQSLFPSGQNGRIVLFSDGNETAGSILEAANLLKQRGIVLDYVKIQGNIGTDMAITEFAVPSALYEGETVQMKMKITSNYAKEANVRIYLNDKELLQEKVEVKEGTNSYTLTHKAEETGLFIYKAVIAAEDDTFPENNTLSAISNVKGTPKILVVQQEAEVNYLDLLKSTGLVVDSITPKQLPSALSGYLHYDSIIFNNISATDVGENKMALIEQAVKEFGTGFVMAGGDNSYGLGGYFKTPIEELLPVYMEVKGKEEIPSLGLIIVLDRSGSMEGEKLLLAKEAAARSVELLREKDTLGFIAFDDRPWEIIEAAPLQDKEDAIGQIRSVTSGGGTEIFTALQKAYERLTPLELQRKHIILLTDGQSATTEDYQRLIEEGKSANITLSTVALGQDADKRLLSTLAENGSGRFYDVIDDSTIPSILSRETAMITRTYIVDDPFYPVIHNQPNWNSIFENGVPEMNAYIAVTPKDTAQIILSSTKDDPILAEWQYGLGRTVAFTSGLDAQWAGSWTTWEKWPLFLNHLITRTLPTFNDEPFAVHVNIRDSQAIIQLTSSDGDMAPIEVAIVSQTGEAMDASTKMISPGKHEVAIEQVPGEYFLRIKQMTEDGEEKLYKTGFTIPYSDELLDKEANFSLLDEAVALTGGKGLENEKMAFSPLPERSVKHQSIVQWLVFIAFLFLFIEIAIRRFGLNMIHRLFKRVNMQQPKEQSKGLNVENLQKKVERHTEEKRRKGKVVHNKNNNLKLDPKRPTLKETESDKEKNRQEQMKKLLEAKNKRNQ